jgi:hypothetical protein
MQPRWFRETGVLGLLTGTVRQIREGFELKRNRSESTSCHGDRLRYSL